MLRLYLPPPPPHISRLEESRTVYAVFVSPCWGAFSDPKISMTVNHLAD